MATRPPTTKQSVVNRFEDALQLIICLRGSREIPGDVVLGSVQRKLEEGLTAFDDLWETTAVAKRRKP
jgi:hypothetical protein